MSPGRNLVPVFSLPSGPGLLSVSVEMCILEISQTCISCRVLPSVSGAFADIRGQSSFLSPNRLPALWCFSPMSFGVCVCERDGGARSPSIALAGSICRRSCIPSAGLKGILALFPVSLCSMNLACFIRPVLPRRALFQVLKCPCLTIYLDPFDLPALMFPLFPSHASSDP